MKKRDLILKISGKMKKAFLYPKENPPHEFFKRKERSECRFCGGPIRALNNNGIIGPGYREWNYVCKHCGKVQ